MSPYKLITGSNKNIAEFEEQISKALQEGYDLANDLVVHPKNETEVLLFQALICDDALDTDEEDEEDEEYEDEDEEELEEEAD